jgi:UPF0755 protein
MKRGVLWILVSVTLLASFTILAYWDFTVYMSSPISKEKPAKIKVVIPEGSTLTQVANLLRDREVVRSPTYFRIYLLVNEKADRLRAGVYHFFTDQTPIQIADELVSGPRTPYVVLTIREGYNVWQIAQTFEEAGLADAKKVLALLKDPAMAEKARVPRSPKGEYVVSSLEGFIFPETYYVEPGQSLERIILRMVEQYNKELRKAKKDHLEEYSRLLEKVGLSDHDIVTLASLVERETALPHEKKLVASVFLNRIRKQMRLQTDPTLTYSEERRGAAPTKEDRENGSNPYNTYAHDGFPPGPICNPGRESLAAAVAPSQSGFLFFVAKRDGTGGHHFTTNYDDHRRAVKKYLKSAKK